MPRTTLDIDGSVLRALKRIARSTGKSLGQIVSELLAPVVRTGHDSADAPGFSWAAKPMQARIDLEDKDAVQAALDRP